MAKKTEAVKQTKKEVAKNDKTPKARKGGFEELTSEELSTIIGGYGLLAARMSW
jgi:bacteriocin-like protein